MQGARTNTGTHALTGTHAHTQAHARTLDMHLISAVDSAALAPVRKLRTLPRAPSQRLRRERDEGRGRESGLRVENERLRRLAHDARREADIRAVPLPADRERSRPLGRRG